MSGVWPGGREVEGWRGGERWGVGSGAGPGPLQAHLLFALPCGHALASTPPCITRTSLVSMFLRHAFFPLRELLASTISSSACRRVDALPRQPPSSLLPKRQGCVFDPVVYDADGEQELTARVRLLWSVAAGREHRGRAAGPSQEANRCAKASR